MAETYFTFATTHHALWAEEVARAHRILSEVVPTPARATGRCNLALITTAVDAERLTATLRAEGVPFEILRG
jgi:hypothetical protein